MLIVGVFSPSQLDQLWCGHRQQVASFPALSSLFNTAKDLRKNCLYTFRLEDHQPAVGRLLLSPGEDRFTLEPAALEASHSPSRPDRPELDWPVKDISVRVPERLEPRSPLRPTQSPVRRQQSRPSLLQSHCHTVLESAAEQECSASFTPSKQRQEICREVDEYLLQSQLQTERRLAQLRVKKTPRVSPSPVARAGRERAEAAGELIAVGSADQEKQPWDSGEKENMTPNIKAKMAEMFEADLTEDVREDLYLEGRRR